ncbi:MAG: DUF45 domain-containing protein, partial [Hyphomicrobiales bacterium]|nr:DUF45 domain-containing protein [Hyphomicrobiales bacterium]
MRALLQYTLDLFGDDPAPGAARSPVPATEAAPTKLVIPPASGERSLDAAFSHPRANRQASLCGHLVAYELTRCKRRSIGLSVGAEGLVVRAPRWVSVSDVQQAIDERASWIVRKLHEARVRQARLQANRIVWRDGAALPFLGAPIRMVLDPSHA